MTPSSSAVFSAQPLAERRRQILGLRAQSEAAKDMKTAEIMDVAPAAVEDVLRAHGYPRLIHGHTHRPARHVHVVDGQRMRAMGAAGLVRSRGGYLRAAEVRRLRCVCATRSSDEAAARTAPRDSRRGGTSFARPGNRSRAGIVPLTMTG
jgi:hypothetical protein